MSGSTNTLTAQTAAKLLDLASGDQRPLPPELLKRCRDFLAEFRAIGHAAVDALENSVERDQWIAVLKARERDSGGEGDAGAFAQDELAEMSHRLRTDAAGPIQERLRIHGERALALLLDLVLFAQEPTAAASSPDR